MAPTASPLVVMSPNKVIANNQPRGFSTMSNVMYQLVPTVPHHNTVVSSQHTSMPTTMQTSTPQMVTTSQVMATHQVATSQMENTVSSQVAHAHPVSIQVVPSSESEMSTTQHDQSQVVSSAPHVESVTSLHEAETMSTSHQSGETLAEHHALDTSSWPELQIVQSSSSSTSTSHPSGTTSATGQDQIHHQITTGEEGAAIQLTSVTPQLSSILSELAQAVATSTDNSAPNIHGGTEHVMMSARLYQQHQAAHHHQLTMETSSGLVQVHADPVSAASMVAGVSAEDIEVLDISIPPSLSGLSVTDAEHLVQEEIDTGICK